MGKLASWVLDLWVIVKAQPWRAQFLFHYLDIIYRVQNLRSVCRVESIVRGKIDKEVKEGRVLSPFSMSPLENLRGSPLGIVPKKAQDEFQLIHHLVFPEGMSVTDTIPPELCTVRYTSFYEAVHMVRKCVRIPFPGSFYVSFSLCNVQSSLIEETHTHSSSTKRHMY